MASVKPPTIYPGVDTIRQVQQLMLVCSLLPTDGRLRELLERALATSPDPIKSRLEPITDLHPHAVKAWFERNWPPERVSAAERELIDWQGNSDNMTSAIAELQDVESVIGIKLIGVTTS
jgi:hypothetical protein